jgi:divalent metal cation (Fe/Co/Zn/Cd) transporter
MHMAADALVSVGVVIAGLVILFTGWAWLDPVVSLAINAVIVWGTWSLLRGSVEMSLNAVPQEIDSSKVRAFLAMALPHPHPRLIALRKCGRRFAGRALAWFRHGFILLGRRLEGSRSFRFDLPVFLKRSTFNRSNSDRMH